MNENIIIVDMGSGTIRCGDLHHPIPTLCVRNIVGVYGDSLESKHIEVGNKATFRNDLLEMVYPMRNGVITDWDAMDLLWENTFDYYFKSQEEKKHHTLHMTYHSLSPKKQHHKIIETMLEKYDFQQFQSIEQSKSALYTQGMTSGVVVNSGEDVTTVTSFLESIQNSEVQLTCGGNDVTALLQHLVLYRGRGYMGDFSQKSFFEPSYERNFYWEDFRKAKEKFCYVACNYELEEKLSSEIVTSHAFNLSDGRRVVFRSEQYKACECLFDPSLIGKPYLGVMEAITGIPNLDDLNYKVVLLGCNALLPGFETRLSAYLKRHNPEFDVLGERYTFRSYIGTQIICEVMKSNKDYWITKHNWNEEGYEYCINRLGGINTFTFSTVNNPVTVPFSPANHLQDVLYQKRSGSSSFDTIYSSDSPLFKGEELTIDQPHFLNKSVTVEIMKNTPGNSNQASYTPSNVLKNPVLLQQLSQNIQQRRPTWPSRPSNNQMSTLPSIPSHMNTEIPSMVASTNKITPNPQNLTLKKTLEPLKKNVTHPPTQPDSSINTQPAVHCTGIQRLQRREEIDNDTTYRGAIETIAYFAPTKSCKDYVLSLQDIEGCNRFPYIVKECECFITSKTYTQGWNTANLTYDEMLAVCLYAWDLRPNGREEDNFYFMLNRMLRKRSNEMMGMLGGYLYYMQKGLSKIPNFEGKVFRGVTDAELVKVNYLQGRRIHWSSFSSTSTNFAAAKEFATSNGVILVINIVNGKSIKEYSRFGDEAEILLSPNMCFIVSQKFNKEQGFNQISLVQEAPDETFVF